MTRVYPYLFVGFDFRKRKISGGGRGHERHYPVAMKLKFWQRTRKSAAELRQEQDNRLRAAEELRRAEMDSERSREQSRVPGAMRNTTLGGF